jgi:uncharacterized membrane-anchored protein
MINHPERISLHNEVHARPRPPVTAPHRVSAVALLRGDNARAQSPEALAALCRDYHLTPPSPGQGHFYGDFGAFRIKWERHGEFDDYTVYRAGADGARPFADPAIDALPRGWLDTLAGQVIAAVHVVALAGNGPCGDPAPAAAHFETDEVVGACLGDGAASVFTDLRLGSDGFSRVLLVVDTMRPTQLGREVQRMIELEVYRLAAMLGFPLARVAATELDEVERGLGALAGRIESASAEEEPALLREVTHLAAIVERLSGTTSFRFGATRAYHALVNQRGSELRERRISGMQTVTGFLERRFGPAMAFTESVARRLESSAQRIERASALLRTRVEIERERQNQEMLAAMNRRAQLQLRLQQTVEGLSVAAITYYAAGLLGYVFKAAKAAGAPINPDVATGLAVVPVALVVALGVRHIRHAIRQRLAKEPHAFDD